jgi:CheY-like chemotaxis protein
VAAEMGAFSFLEKPVSKEALEGSFAHLTQFLDRKVRRLLVVEDNPQAQKAIAALIGGPDVEVTAAGSAEEALSLLEQREFDCMVLDLVLPGLDGARLLERIKTQERFHELPVVVFTGHDLTPEESHALRRYAEAVILKSSTLSYEQLLDQTALFLHRVETKLSQETREMLDRARGADPTLAGLKVLVVDDDARNIFALMSILEDHNVELISASSGREAVDLLRKRNDIDMVLMDIMMPEMDGYETTRVIRQIPELQHLPVIALTAKALAEDRERCLAAGASDYLPKPFEPERLLELIRYWTRKSPRTGEHPPASVEDRH